MTKTIRLTKDYLNLWKDPKGLNKALFANGKQFFNHAKLPLSEGESFRAKDIAANPANVPIYVIPKEVSKKYTNLKKPIPDEEIVDYITRYLGSVSTPVECYGCNEGECIEAPTAKADEFLNLKFPVPDPGKQGQTLIKSVMEEVG